MLCATEPGALVPSLGPKAKVILCIPPPSPSLSSLFLFPHFYFGLVFVLWPNNLPQQGTTRAALLSASEQHGLIQRVSWDSRWSLKQPHSPAQQGLSPEERTCSCSRPCAFTKAADFFFRLPERLWFSIPVRQESVPCPQPLN